MNIVEPYHPIIRSGANPGAMTAFGWFVDGRPDAAQRVVDKLDADTAMRALTAASDMAIALGRRLKQLREETKALLCDAVNPFNPSHRCTLGLGHSAELAHTDGDATWLPDPISLPYREDTACAYCGKPDCAHRWNHDRWNADNDEEIRRRAQEPALTWWKWDKR